MKIEGFEVRALTPPGVDAMRIALEEERSMRLKDRILWGRMFRSSWLDEGKVRYYFRKGVGVVFNQAATRDRVEEIRLGFERVMLENGADRCDFVVEVLHGDE